jgi:hypothetical protein
MKARRRESAQVEKAKCVGDVETSERRSVLDNPGLSESVRRQVGGSAESVRRKSEKTEIARSAGGSVELCKARDEKAPNRS